MFLVNPHRTPVALIALGATLLLASCGGDDEPTQTTAPAVTGADEQAVAESAPSVAAPEDEPSADPATDRQSIHSSLQAVLTSSDPREVCSEYVTERYVREAYGDGAGCERAQADTRLATAARVSRIVVLPESVAQASVMPDGGPYGGDRLRAELVLDGGVWKVDSLRANVPVGP